jgi:signal peptidase I
LVVALGVAVVGVVLAVVSILVTGGETAGYRTWHQQSRAMEPTYPEGSDVMVKPIDGSGVRRGDVVLFSARDWGADSVFMMRVIAVGGDHVVIDETGTRVSVNGKTLREPYISKHDPDFGPPVDVTVPANRLFLLGDHRDIAADSRAHYEHSGTIARSAVVGVAVDRASAPSPDRLWVWVGASTAAAGLVAAAVAATVRRRRTGVTQRI